MKNEDVQKVDRRVRGFNDYRIEGDIAFLALTDIHRNVIAEALVDVADLPRLISAGKRWHRGNGHGESLYVQGSGPVYLHRFLIADTALEIDHINRNKLDNRRVNLRICTRSENTWNRPAQSNNTSGFKGVEFQKRRGTWRASIRVNGKSRYLGAFPNPERAAHAYDRAAQELHGEFAVLNFPHAHSSN